MHKSKEPCRVCLSCLNENFYASTSYKRMAYKLAQILYYVDATLQIVYLKPSWCNVMTVSHVSSTVKVETKTRSGKTSGAKMPLILISFQLVRVLHMSTLSKYLQQITKYYKHHLQYYLHIERHKKWNCEQKASCWFSYVRKSSKDNQKTPPEALPGSNCLRSFGVHISETSDQAPFQENLPQGFRSFISLKKF